MAPRESAVSRESACLAIWWGGIVERRERVLVRQTDRKDASSLQGLKLTAVDVATAAIDVAAVVVVVAAAVVVDVAAVVAVVAAVAVDSARRVESEEDEGGGGRGCRLGKVQHHGRLETRFLVFIRETKFLRNHSRNKDGNACYLSMAVSFAIKRVLDMN